MPLMFSAYMTVHLYATSQPIPQRFTHPSHAPSCTCQEQHRSSFFNPDPRPAPGRSDGDEPTGRRPLVVRGAQPLPPPGDLGYSRHSPDCGNGAGEPASSLAPPALCGLGARAAHGAHLVPAESAEAGSNLSPDHVVQCKIRGPRSPRPPGRDGSSSSRCRSVPGRHRAD